MKKRILSILLAMCMLMSMLPVAAFAGEDDGGDEVATPAVYPANLADTREDVNHIADENLYTDYDVEVGTPSTADNTTVIPVTVTATGLRQHASANNIMAYWVGVAIPKSEFAEQNGATVQVQTGFAPWKSEENKDPDQHGNITHSDQYGTVESVKTSEQTVDGVECYTFYWSPYTRKDGGELEPPVNTKFGYVSIETTASGDAPKTYKDYIIDMTDVVRAEASITAVGYNEVGAKASAAIDAAASAAKGNTVTGVAPDCDIQTMWFAVKDIPAYVEGVNGESLYKVQVTKDGTTPVVMTQTSAAVKDRVGPDTPFASTTGYKFVYWTFNASADQANGTVVANNLLGEGTYSFQLQKKTGNNTWTNQGTAVTMNIGKVTVGDKSAFFNVAAGEKVSDVLTIADPTPADGKFFTGWKTGDNDPITTQALNNTMLTKSVAYTAVFEDDSIVSAELGTKDEGEFTKDPGVTVKVEGSTITLTGAIAEAGDYVLQYTTKGGTIDDVNVTVAANGTVTLKADETLSVGETTYTVTGALTIATVVAKNPSVDIPADLELADGDESKLSAALVGDNKVTITDDSKDVLIAAASEKAADIIDAAKDDMTDGAEYKIEISLAIEPTEYSSADNKLVLEITPVVNLVNKANTEDVIPVENVPVSVERPVVITVTLPTGMAASVSSSLYVKHIKDSNHTYIYGTDISETGSGTGVYTATFTNPHGFSTFEITANGPAATVNGIGYETLAKAVEAIPTNGSGTITINKALTSADAVTVDRVVTITLTAGQGVTLIPNLLVAGSNVERDSSDTQDVYTFTAKTVTPTSPGGGGGGSSASVSVPSASNGKVTVSNSNAKKGDTVTITLTPNDGYVVDTVTVTDAKGNTVEVSKTDDTHYTFVMPDGRVTVKATFKQADVTTPPETGFTDVAADAYYADAVKWAVDNGITNGLTATTFGPNNSCTRGQMVTFLWRAAGSPAATGTNSFADVASGEYYYNAVLWAVEKGITNGTSATTFSPNATVTRGQTVTFLYRYAESPAATGATSFTDVTADAYYADAVKWAVAEGITNGTSDTTFAPASNCTRGQIVTFLYRQIAE